MEETQAKQQLLDYINERISLTDEEKNIVANAFHLRSFKKKEYFLEQGRPNRMEAFVVSGTFRVFHTDIKSTEHVLYFGFKDWWVGDSASFNSDIPSLLNVQALEESSLLFINWEDKERLYDSVPKLERLFRIITMRTLTVLQKRFFLTVGASAEDRYLELLERHPGIEQLVPQHQIASYLGILPESLSRMKKHLIERSKS
ncbi:MAG: Crp/Fnr family transcriptional regulator [Crocinitomicaceae bacterium]